MDFRSQSVYNSPLPDVLEILVTDFKGYLKEQKYISDQYNKFSDTKLKEVHHKTVVQNQVRDLLLGGGGGRGGREEGGGKKVGDGGGEK